MLVIFNGSNFYLLECSLFDVCNSRPGLNLETRSATIKVSVRPGSVDGGDTIKFMIMSAIWKRNRRSGYSLNLVSMSVINRSKGKISMGMRDPGGCRFGRTSVLMAMPIIKRGNAAKAVNMNGPSIPRSNIHSMRMHRV
jgi:hypothetical protein